MPPSSIRRRVVLAFILGFLASPFLWASAQAADITVFAAASLTENGRSRERSTGTADREQAEIIFAEWLQARGRKSGPSDPSQILITDILTDYATERATKVAAPRIIGCAIDSLSCFWEARTVVEVTPQTCSRY